MQRVARRAGLAAPAVAVVGALAATPQVRHLVSGSATASAGQLATARIGDPGQALTAAVGEASSARRETVFSQHAKTASGHGPARPARRPVARKPVVVTSAPASPQPAASSAPSAPAASGSGVPHCTGSSGMLPENYAAIVDFLVGHGYSDNAAAGIAGNMYQESKGDPESVGDGGGGLIGWTPLPAGYVTGNVSADLQTQLAAVLTFNDQWAQYLPALNGASTSAAAADIYVTDFERAGIPAAGTREASAEAVAAACGI